MKLIKLTCMDSTLIYVNPAQIGHLYETVENRMKCTRVGVTTHNNGGFIVKETPRDILELIRG